MREYKEMSIDLIDESDNIRRSFSEEKLQELASSIRQRGVLKPILEAITRTFLRLLPAAPLFPPVRRPRAADPKRSSRCSSIHAGKSY